MSRDRKPQKLNRDARERYITSIPEESLREGEKLVEPKTFEGVPDAFREHEHDQRLGVEPEDYDFPQVMCPVCNNEKVRKDRAIEASRKTEMILTIRDIVRRFKNETDAKLSGLSNQIVEQLKPIVALSSAVTIAKHNLDMSLGDLEANLKEAFGIKDEVDPKTSGEAMFMENEEGEPLTLFDEPAPGENPVFDTLTQDVDDVLGNNDPEESAPAEKRAMERIVGYGNYQA